MDKYEYEIRQVDAWANGEPYEWTYNDSWVLGTMVTSARDHKKAFTKWLRDHGIVCTKGTTRVEYDGSVYEVVIRKTGEPLFVAIPMNF